MAFDSTSSYIATDALKQAVNAAVVLERPLLIKGEPGTGKTLLAEELAESLDTQLITWHIKAPRRPRVCTSTMRSAACAIHSWV